MKQSLQLKLGQHLTMTPQLQQAIRLLQLSTLDLQQEIQEAVETNPMLEVEPDEGDGNNSSSEKQEQAEANSQNEAAVDQTDTIPDDLPVDAAWDDIYEPAIPTHAASSEFNDHVFEQGEGEESLVDHLLWQMQLTHLSDRDREIVTTIVDSIDDDGYLTTPLEDIRGNFPEDMEVELDEIEAMLSIVQSFDPIGIGARDLRECMLLQLAQLSEETPWLSEARLLVDEYLDLLAGRDYSQLLRRMKLSEAELQQVIQLAQSLNPRPGGYLTGKKTEYIVPDLIVKKVKGIWRVELNSDAMPRVRINSMYSNMVKRANNSSDNTYMKNQLQEARWFLKSLQSRNETLLKVGKCIVERQRGFLDYGEEAMKALVLNDISEAIEMHESTVSRVTNKKYMHTPRGIFELKYFFSSHVSTVGGGECSSTAIRALIKKLVAAEDARKPLSDSKLASVLAEQGIKVARRTVAKYREAMSIVPSNERKRLG
jgi:RNA polymerase sigma-54 factor